ncbi:MAG: hypothetical protein KGI06_02930 [Candidatus Micrarchaeota archaeon]|nr:hypothetical protein [Candidatus Micrarchaeota archaeon]
MKKKLVFIGLGLIAVAVAMFLLSGYLLSSGLGNNIQLTNLTINAGGFSYVPISYGRNISALAIYAVMGKPANLYILNNSTFNSWRSYVVANSSASGIKYMLRSGINSSYIYRNTTLEVIPIRLSSTPYSSASGKLYIVVDNTPGSSSSNVPVNASISYIQLHSSNLLTSAALGYGVFIIGISGIIILIWGFVKKGEPGDGKDSKDEAKSKEQKDKEYVEQLYKGVKKKKG